MQHNNSHVRKLNKKAQTCVIISPKLSCGYLVSVTLDARPPLMPVAQKLCGYEHGVFTIPEHYFASKSFANIREAFNNAYPENEVPNKAKVHRLVTIFRNRKCLL
jgi:hypothetical protein